MSSFDPTITPDSSQDLEVFRYRTALNRSRLSQPMALLTSYGVIRHGRTILDYGCGQGDDVSGLQAAGYDVAGWDPFFRADAPLQAADVVNLGFVLNVIEDPAERAEALAKAWSLTRCALAVSVMLSTGQQTAGQRPYGDGVLTSRGTFQKYYGRAELRDLVSRVTGETPLSVAQGIVFVFRDEAAEDEYLFERHASRRRDISGIVSRRERKQPFQRLPAAERIAPALQEIADLLLSRGRLPYPDELSPASGSLLQSERVSLQRASDLAVSTVVSAERLQEAGKRRQEDLLVHAAATLLRARKVEASSGSSIGRDIRSHFGSLTAFEDRTRSFLFGLSDSEAVTASMNAANASGLGVMDDENRLIVAGRRLDELSPDLRTYVSCASILGEPEGEFLARIDAARKRVKFFLIQNPSAPCPVTEQQIVVDLRRQQVFEQNRSRKILRKADLFGMSPRSKQRTKEAALRAALALEEAAVFADVAETG
ncbi:DNA phosphorothioation-associated putative methyltransferase [Jiella sp. M17.18]|uniref:DNA phosphorothioation-associated putative methyltransferase n=1 Tax=Jiella sp. M17.18 TaxID=3234247 RepID=UPI0034DFA59A